MKDLYERDFYAWTKAQAELLRQGTWEQLDLPNLIEEIESLGRQERQELRNRLGILLGHLLKWQYQPAHRSNSWRATIQEQRTRLQLVLNDNPSLKPYLPEAIEIGYRLGQSQAVQETGLDHETFLPDCPYSPEQILDDGFFPERT
jgi:Domain of unknown function DUF29